jgi:hypothetical protein
MINILTSYGGRNEGLIAKKTRTVDCDGNALGEDEAVLALEGWDLSELVELQVLGRDTLSRLSGNELDIETVLLCDSEEGGGTRVTLTAALERVLLQIDDRLRNAHIPRSCRAFRKT